MYQVNIDVFLLIEINILFENLEIKFNNSDLVDNNQIKIFNILEKQNL